MRIAVMGTGAVGGYFGAKLATAGHELAFIARGRHLQALRANGLRVTSANDDLQIDNAQFTDDTATIGKVDLILFCVKSYDTETTAEQIRPLVNDRTLILSLQNGIDNPEKLAHVYRSRASLTGGCLCRRAIDLSWSYHPCQRWPNYLRAKRRRRQRIVYIAAANSQRCRHPL